MRLLFGVSVFQKLRDFVIVNIKVARQHDRECNPGGWRQGP